MVLRNLATLNMLPRNALTRIMDGGVGSKEVYVMQLWFPKVSPLGINFTTVTIEPRIRSIVLNNILSIATQLDEFGDML